MRKAEDLRKGHCRSNRVMAVAPLSPDGLIRLSLHAAGRSGRTNTMLVKAPRIRPCQCQVALHPNLRCSLARSRRRTRSAVYGARRDWYRTIFQSAPAISHARRSDSPNRAFKCATASCSCRIPMICSSLRIVRFIFRPFLGADSSHRWRKNPLAGRAASTTPESHAWENAVA